MIGQRLVNDLCDDPERGKRLYRAAGVSYERLDMSLLSNTPDAGEK